MIKSEYEIWEQVSSLDKEQLLDKLIDILDNTQDLDWTTESFCIVEAFKKMNGRKVDGDRLGCSKKYLLENGVPENEIVRL